MNLIMGTVTNMFWYALEPFANSLRHNTDIACVFFTSGLSERCLRHLHEYNIDTVPIPSLYHDMHVTDYRWILYRDYLESRASRYDFVLLCDIRDVVFRGDFFSASIFQTNSSFIGLALESGRICDDPFNSTWMINKFGQEAYAHFSEKRVICAGTIWGDVRSIISLCADLEKLIYSDTHPYFPSCDQTSLQYWALNDNISQIPLVYSDVLESSDASFVATIGSMPENRALPYYDNKNYFLIHQYDRFKALRDAVNKTYRHAHVSSVNCTDPESSDASAFAGDLFDFLYDLIENHSYRRATDMILQDCTGPESPPPPCKKYNGTISSFLCSVLTWMFRTGVCFLTHYGRFFSARNRDCATLMIC